MKLTELAQAIEDGKAIVVEDIVYHPPYSSRDIIILMRALIIGNNKVSIAPTKEPIDLSVLIQSGIDCEFSDLPPGIGYRIGKLRQTQHRPGSTRVYLGEVDGLAGAVIYDRCKPRMNHWLSWQGGECPLPEGVLIEYRMRDRSFQAQKTPMNLISVLRWHWESEFDDSDIIAFRVTGLAKGYCWPWEEK